MRTRLPIFALAVVIAAAVGWAVANWNSRAESATAASEEPTRYAADISKTSNESAGEVVVPDIGALLRQAVAQLSAVGSIEAKVRQRTNLFGRELIGSGSYAQQGAGISTRLRLEMRTRASNAEMELLQVANGETLWMFNAADGMRTLRRVDIDRVQDAMRRETPEGTFAAPTGNSIGLGGLPWMLDALTQFCDFTTVQTSRLGDVEVYIVEGTWRNEKLLALIPEGDRQRVASGGKIDVARLPAHLSDRVTIYLGRDDLFPYRFDYRRTQPVDESQPQVTEAAKTKPIMTLEFYEVRFGRNLPLEMFNYKPGQNANDDTERYIERLKAAK
jgi:hypothetical protein